MTRIHTDPNGVVVNAVTGKQLSDGIIKDTTGHAYEVTAGDVTTFIDFQHGPVPAKGVNGMTSEALLVVLLHRTRHLNGLYPCAENEQAIVAMQGALAAFEARTASRQARGVEGQYAL